MLIIFFSSYQKCVDELYKVNCPQKTSLTRAVIFFAAVYLFKIYLLLCLAFIWWTIVPEIWRTSTCSFQLLHAARGMSLCTKLFHYFLISLSCFSNIFSKHCYRFHYLHFRLCGRKKKGGVNCRGPHHPSMVQSTMLLPAVCLINGCASHWVCVIGASKVFRSTLCLIALEVKSMRHIPCREKFIPSF